MHDVTTVWLLSVSFAASALGGVLGMASGIFIVPLLTAFGNIDIHVAIGASIVSVIACSCGSAGSFLKSGLTNVRLAIVLEVATTAGALTGVFLDGSVPARILYLIFAAVLLVSAQQMLSRRGEPTAADGITSHGWARQLDASYPDNSLGREIFYRVGHLPLGLGLMYGAGLISALLGIGSGVLKIPAMDSALKLPIKVSSATSNFMIGVTAAASGAAYFMQGAIDPNIAGPVALGSVTGSMTGARLLMIIPNEKARLLFIAVLLLLSGQMLLSAFEVQ